MKAKNVTLGDVRNFIEGNMLYFSDLSLQKLDQHIKEQALYRAMLCQDCLMDGKCRSCGCKTPQLFYAPKKVDAEKRWHTMLPKEFWEKFKEIYEIELPKDFQEIIKDIKIMNLQHFKMNEFVMGTENVFSFMDKDFLIKLDELREASGVSLTILSSYRSPSYNKKVGGVSRSFHLQGRAADIRVNTGEDRAKVIKAALNLGLTVGVMKTALHIDNRKTQKLFHYYTRYPRTENEQNIDG